MTIRRRIAGPAIALALAAGLTLAGCSAGGGNPGSSPHAGPSSPGTAEAAKTAGLNTPVTVGTFRYTALGAKDVGQTVGESPLTQTAQGTFFQVDLTVSNTGDKANLFLVNYLKVKDAAGKTYDADPTATLYATGAASTWVASINPGNTVQGAVLFDLPVGVHPVTLMVSDNAFTPGTPIGLG